MKINILGQHYTIKVFNKKKFKKLHGKCWGITDLDNQYIHLRKDKLFKRVIAHEVAHAVYHLMCQEELELDKHAQEEFLCDFVGIHGEQIVKVTNEIYKKIK